MPKTAQEIEDLALLGRDCLAGQNGRARDVEAALACFLEAARHGDSMAQCELALLYYDTELEYADFEKARYWAEQAAAQGDGVAAATLGEIYEYGEGVAVDLITASYWYDRAVFLGFRYAKKQLRRVEKAIRRGE